MVNMPFRPARLICSDCLTLTMKTTQFFENLVNIRPWTWRHVQNDLNVQQNRYDKVKSRIRYLFSILFQITRWSLNLNLHSTRVHHSSLEDVSGMFSKCCVQYFVCSDNEYSSKSRQWCFASNSLFLVGYRRCFSDRSDSSDGGDTDGMAPYTVCGHIRKITEYKTAVGWWHKGFRFGCSTSLIVWTFLRNFV